MPNQIVYPVDLHTHSSFSDGLKSPRELCRMADKLKLTHIALSDHDTLDGQPDMAHAAEDVRRARQARGDDTPFTAIPCVELSSGQGGRVHLMGYAPNPDDPALAKCLRDAAEDRAQRAARMLELLKKQGQSIPDELLKPLQGSNVGRAHIARAMVSAGLVHSMQEAFDRFLAEGASAYVARRLLAPADALGLLKGAGAVTALAHPTRLTLSEPMTLALIEELVGYGLDAVEAYHPSASKSEAKQLGLYARRRGLLVTGGSDYHGDPNARTKLGHMPGGWAAVKEDVEVLMERVKPC